MSPTSVNCGGSLTGGDGDRGDVRCRGVDAAVGGAAVVDRGDGDGGGSVGVGGGGEREGAGGIDARWDLEQGWLVDVDGERERLVGFVRRVRSGSRWPIR